MVNTINGMLKDDNVILRPLKLTDWEKTISWRNDLDLKNLAMMHPYPITEFIEREWYIKMLENKSNEVIYFTITDRDDSPLGYILLKNINYLHRHCDLGIIIGEKSQQGKGLGFSAIKLLVQYGFRILNMNKISVEVLATNMPALRVYEKVGFTKEGCLKKHFFSDGAFNDVLILSIFSK